MRVAVVGPAEPRELAEILKMRPDDLPSGLGGTPVTALVRGLIRQGHSVTLVTASPSVQQPVSFTSESLTVEVVRYRPRALHRARDLFYAERKALRHALRKHSVDVVHAHWTYEFAWAALGGKTPVLVTAHDSPPETVRQYRDAYRLIRAVMAYRVRLGLRHLTVVSPYLESEWRRGMAWRGETRVIPNISPFEPQVSVAEPPADTLRIVDIADGSERKNVRALIIALDIIREREPGATLTLIGGGLGPTDELALWAAANGHQNGVRFLGACDRETVARELRRASMFVHASLEESQPMCLLEAMAFELPIVAGRDAGGTGWTLDYGVAGCLSTLEPRSLALSILKLHADPTCQQRLVENASHLLRSRYSEEVVTTAYVDAYKAISQR